MSLPRFTEPDRLFEVARLGVDREIERAYLGDIVAAVAERIETPFALVSGLLSDAQVFLAGTGPMPQWVGEVGGTPIEWAFCGPLVAERTPRFVKDFTLDPVFRDNPLVTIEGVRSYIGAPLISSRGHVLGGLCALDMRPRDYDAGHLRLVRELAEEAVRRIEEQADPPS